MVYVEDQPPNAKGMGLLLSPLMVFPNIPRGLFGFFVAKGDDEERVVGDIVLGN